MPGLARDGLSTLHAITAWRQYSKMSRILPAYSGGERFNTRTSKVTASRAQTKASHKRARCKARSSTPTRLRRMQAQHMYNNVPVVRNPPDAMARNQHGHSKTAWTDAHLARACEHESLLGSLGEGMWHRVTQEQDESRLEAIEAKGPSATFPQKGLSRKHGPGIQSRTLY